MTHVRPSCKDEEHQSGSSIGACAQSSFLPYVRMHSTITIDLSPSFTILMVSSSIFFEHCAIHELDIDLESFAQSQRDFGIASALLQLRNLPPKDDFQRYSGSLMAPIFDGDTVFRIFQIASQTGTCAC